MPPKGSQLKTSIYLDPDILRTIAQREVGAGTRSEVIRSCVERYAELCRRCCPDLTSPEWQFLFGVLNEDWLAGRPSASYIVPALRDYMGRGGKPPADADAHSALGALERASFPELVAVLDEAERWWAAVARGEQPKTPAER